MTDQTPLSVHTPEGSPKGGIVVIQEAFGVNAYIEDVCRRFAAEGWLAVAPHLFHRTGDPQIPYDAMGEAQPHMQEFTRDRVLTDVDAALAHLRAADIPAGRQGVVGFCMGGWVSLLVATERTVGAAVTFYGGGITRENFGFPPLVEAAPRLRAPWIGLYGDLDEHIPVENVEQLRGAAARSSHPTEVVRYPDAGHAFHCDARETYHAPSATDAWRRTLDCFYQHLANGWPSG